MLYHTAFYRLMILNPHYVCYTRFHIMMEVDYCNTHHLAVACVEKEKQNECIPYLIHIYILFTSLWIVLMWLFKCSCWENAFSGMVACSGELLWCDDQDYPLCWRPCCIHHIWMVAYTDELVQYVCQEFFLDKKSCYTLDISVFFLSCAPSSCECSNHSFG